MAPSFCTASICTAFQGRTIGTKVLDTIAFLNVLARAVAAHDASKDRFPGQSLVSLPAEGISTVSGGVGTPSSDPDHYVLREHRGNVSAYLKRERAAPPVRVEVVVYTIDAALNDPDCDPDEQARLLHFKSVGTTHVVVAVLASADSTPPALSPYRFTHNLAGGNHEAMAWTADEIRAKAVEIMAADKRWCVVAD